ADHAPPARPGRATRLRRGGPGTAAVRPQRNPWGGRPDVGRVARPAVAVHPPFLPRDRGAAARLPAHRQVPGDVPVPEAGRLVAERGHPAGAGAVAPRGLDRGIRPSVFMLSGRCPRAARVVRLTLESSGTGRFRGSGGRGRFGGCGGSHGTTRTSASADR